MVTAVSVLLASALAGLILTGIVRTYAVSRVVFDFPNARSSHTQPTPRGGGLAIATILVGCTVFAWVLEFLDARTAIALAGGSVLVAAIGWVDDRGHVPARWRFLVQCAAAAWALLWLGGWDHLQLGFAQVSLGLIGTLLGILLIVWCTNLYNFMDGIDGLAASQAIIVALVGGAFLLVSEAVGLGIIAWSIAGASTGFLVWNWSPARIFMGDVGSGLLGFCFGSMAIASELAGAAPVLVWILLLGVFVFDASVTLVRRWHGGKKWYEAHREHAYQRAVQSGYSHRRVTTAAAALTGILALLAMLAWQRSEFVLVGFAVGIALLAAVYRRIEHMRPMEATPSARLTAGTGSGL